MASIATAFCSDSFTLHQGEKRIEQRRTAFLLQGKRGKAKKKKERSPDPGQLEGKMIHICMDVMSKEEGFSVFHSPCGDI